MRCPAKQKWLLTAGQLLAMHVSGSAAPAPAPHLPQAHQPSLLSSCPPCPSFNSHGLREIVKRVGVTTIIVTHDQEEAWDIADQVWGVVMGWGVGVAWHGVVRPVRLYSLVSCSAGDAALLLHAPCLGPLCPALHPPANSEPRAPRALQVVIFNKGAIEQTGTPEVSQLVQTALSVAELEGQGRWMGEERRQHAATVSAQACVPALLRSSNSPPHSYRLLSLPTSPLHPAALQEVAQAPVSPFVMNFCSDVNHVPSNCQVRRLQGGRGLPEGAASPLAVWAAPARHPQCCCAV